MGIQEQANGLNLDGDSPIQDSKFNMLKTEDYMLPDDKREQLKVLLPEVLECGRWDTPRIAWEPFLQVYLSANVDPELSEMYLPTITNGNPLVEPRYTASSAVAETFRRKNWTLWNVFEHSKGDYKEFSETVLWSNLHLNRIKKVASNRAVFDRVCATLLNDIGVFGYSPHLPYIINVTRWLNASLAAESNKPINEGGTNPVLDAINEQSKIYAGILRGHTDWIKEMVAGRTNAYHWYTQKNIDLMYSMWSDITQQSFFGGQQPSFSDEVTKSLTSNGDASMETMKYRMSMLPQLHRPKFDDKLFIYKLMGSLKEINFSSAPLDELVSNVETARVLLNMFYLQNTYLREYIRSYYDWAKVIADGKFSQTVYQNYVVMHGTKMKIYSAKPQEFADRLVECDLVF